MSIKRATIFLGGFLLLALLLVRTTTGAFAAPLEKVPVTVTQPDGTQLALFASGDEYYNWLEDAQGYTVMQDPVSGYYVYANLVNGELVATKLQTGRDDPAAGGLSPHLNISPEKVEAIRQAFLNQTKLHTSAVVDAPKTGTINNLVVFIRFSNEAEFTTAKSTYLTMLNGATATSNSLRNYYLQASYNKLTINSGLYPSSAGTTVVSYKDSHPRSYYQPYSATNLSGYTGGDNGSQRTAREHTLLKNAITYVNGLNQFPAATSIDGDNDGYVDSLTFVIDGSPTGWASLLWPHQWMLYSYNVQIRGKHVWGYSFHLQSSLDTGVLAHEMFHVLGAPDLYHYSYDGLSPVGYWDVMQYDMDPPQHMSCYMKYKYGHWIPTLPVLAWGNTYTLNALTNATKNCYKIPSPNSSSEYFVVEYRRQVGTFESSLPGSGLLVYRVNPDVTGNSEGPPDELYVYRPGGTTVDDGDVYYANFSSEMGRTQINDTTNPSSFLTNGSAGGLDICNVGSAAGSTMSFDLGRCALITVSGNVGIAGATISYTGGSTTADGSGNYQFTVFRGWSGTVVPSVAGYGFAPLSLSYSHLTSSLTGQNFSPHTAMSLPPVRSTGSQDGWILETGAGSKTGGSIDAASASLRLGDESSRQQYRDILSFGTGALPDDAIVSGATLTLRRQSIVGGGNPITLFGGIYIDVRSGSFGSSPTLQATDFQANPAKAVIGPFKPVPVGSTYTINLPIPALAYINRVGPTQMRLRLKLATNNNSVANYINFFSGNSKTAAYRPTLTINYYTLP